MTGYDSPDEVYVEDIAADVLDVRETLSESQTGDLKMDTGDLRYWLERPDVEDGEPFARTVIVEALVQGRWVHVRTYDGDAPEL